MLATAHRTAKPPGVLIRRRSEATQMNERIYVFKRFERFWHWAQACW